MYLGRDDVSPPALRGVIGEFSFPDGSSKTAELSWMPPDGWTPRDEKGGEIIQALVNSRGVTLNSISESGPNGSPSWNISGDDAKQIANACETNADLAEQKKREEDKFQQDRLTGKDAEYNRIMEKNAERAKQGNKGRRQQYARAVAACDRAASKGQGGDQCPPKAPTCFNENGDLSEVPC